MQKKPSVLPVILSAFVCPGAGQLAQRRWAAALLIMVPYFTSLAVFIYQVMAAFEAALNRTADSKTAVNFLWLLVPLLLLLAIHMLAIIDAKRACLR